MKHHTYQLSVDWTGNTGEGTKSYRSYERSHIISGVGRPAIEGSSDPAFRGDPKKYSPEDLLLASVSSCHMLWFLHLASEAGIIVVAYLDRAEGTMVETPDGGGHFQEVVLRPLVRVKGNPEPATIDAVHHKANKFCFIANSVNFPIRHEPEYEFEG